MTLVADAAYIAAVLTLYVDLPDTPLRASAQDQWLARRLYEQSVPLSLVESAPLLGLLRRILRPADLPLLPCVRSLAYFQPGITELQQPYQERGTGIVEEQQKRCCISHHVRALGRLGVNVGCRPIS
jgi:hypothetical protein